MGSLGVLSSGVVGTTSAQAKPADLSSLQPVTISAPSGTQDAALPSASSPERAGASSLPGAENDGNEPASAPPLTIVAPASPVPSGELQPGETAPTVKPELGGSYIDKTQYSLGATGPYEGPGAIVLSERSSGCQAVLPSGQVVNGLCQSNSSAQQQQSADRYGSSTPIALGPVRVSDRGIQVSDFPIYNPNHFKRPVQQLKRLGKNNTRLVYPLWFPAPITSLFGWRIHPVMGTSRFHAGIDLGAPLGTPVVAAYAGQVAIADALGGYGLTVVLQHHEGTKETLYAHLSEIFVRPGDFVEQGTVIGRVGSTGLSTGPHLHFEMRLWNEQSGWVTVDPLEELETAVTNLIALLNEEAGQAQPQNRAEEIEVSHISARASAGSSLGINAGLNVQG